MRRRGYSDLSVQSIIALVLVAVSFLMLLLPWAGISIEVMGRDYSLSELMETVQTYGGISEAQFKMELQSSIAELTSELADETGIIINARKFANAVNKILDGGLSILDFATISSFSSGVLRDLDKAFAISFSQMSAAERVAISQITNAKTSVMIFAIALWVVIAILAASFAYAVYSLLKRRNNGIIVYTVALVLPIIGFIAFVVGCNNAMQNYGNIVSSMLGDLMWSAGIGGSSNLLSFDIFHLTLAPFVCLACAIGAMLVLRMRISKKVSPVHIGSISNIGKWNCPSCGTQNGMGNAYCLGCGNKRPEKPRCECGAEIKEGAAFCGKCGRKISVIEKPAYTPPVYTPPVNTPPVYTPPVNTPPVYDRPIGSNAANDNPYPTQVNEAPNPGANQGGSKLSGTLFRPNDSDLG